MSIIDESIRLVAEATSVPAEELLGRSRYTHIVRARKILCYVLYHGCKIGLVAVGKVLDGRDHATVRHNIAKVLELSGELWALAECLVCAVREMARNLAAGAQSACNGWGEDERPFRLGAV